MTVFLAQTHIYVTDASSAEEAGSMFGGGGPDMEAPSASFSLWVPRTGESGTPSEEKHPAVEPSNQQPENASQNTPKELLDDLISGFKVWVPNHMLAEDSNNLKAAFLVPTMMNKIFMEVRSCSTENNLSVMFVKCVPDLRKPLSDLWLLGLIPGFFGHFSAH